MWYRLLALAAVGLHFGYLAYLLGGGYLAWRWPRSIGLHMLAAGWALLIVAARLSCPLTWLQNYLRGLGGQPRLSNSFMDSYLRGVCYPAGEETYVRAAVAAAVLISWGALALRFWAPAQRRRTWPVGRQTRDVRSAAREHFSDRL
jgi:hypothetical protein